MPERDPESFLLITFPARLASGAQQMGEHAQVFIYLVARALDANGAGRVAICDVARELRYVYRGRQITRWLEDEKAARYWSVDRQFVRLKAVEKVIDSFECKLPTHDLAIRFSLAVLRTRPQRGAALLAALICTSDEPRSNEYIWKFARVNPKTRASWMQDPVIKHRILRAVHQRVKI